MTAGRREDEMFGAVADWLEGRLDDARAAEVENLVQSDPEATAAAVWFQRFRSAAALSREPVPDALGLRLRTMHPLVATLEHPGIGSSWRDRLVGPLRATVTFDSLFGPGLATARGLTYSTRQLVLSTPTIDVAVDVEPSGSDDALRVSIQLLPHTPDTVAAGVVLEVWTSSGLAVQGRTDKTGRAELERVPATLLVIGIGAAPMWPELCAELDLRGPA